MKINRNLLAEEGSWICIAPWPERDNWSTPQDTQDILRCVGERLQYATTIRAAQACVASANVLPSLLCWQPLLQPNAFICVISPRPISAMWTSLGFPIRWVPRLQLAPSALQELCLEDMLIFPPRLPSLPGQTYSSQQREASVTYTWYDWKASIWR